MAVTYEPITTVTLTSSQQFITLSNISQAYTHLILVGWIIANSVNDIRMEINSDSGNNYNSARLSASGSSRSSGTLLGNTPYLPYAGVVGTVLTPQYIEAQFAYYSTTDNKKAAWGKTGWPNSSGSGEIDIWGYQWNNTNAITSIGIYAQGNNSPTTFAAGSYVSLYGILRA